MNAAARELHEGRFFHAGSVPMLFSRETFKVLFLMLLMLGSALSVVYVKNYERSLFRDIQYANLQTEKLEVEKGQLLLEQSTVATSSRVQLLAERHLGMHIPDNAQLLVVS